MSNPYIKKLLSMAEAAEQRMDAEESRALWAGVCALLNYRWSPLPDIQNEAASFVRARLDDEEIYAQLAEEAAELAHAALKVRRILHGTNPTPVDPDDACERVVEEANDVISVLDTLRIARDEKRIALKLTRWKERLKDADKELHDGD